MNKCPKCGKPYSSTMGWTLKDGSKYRMYVHSTKGIVVQVSCTVKVSK